MASDVLLTLGHGNRSSAAFVELLRGHGVTGVVDIRRYPGSRRNPHVSRRPLAATLTAAGIAYAHVPELGGHREADDDSPHTALDPAYRGYAEHMASAEFGRGLARLAHLRGLATVALMCAEAEPTHCHRRLLCDHLLTQGVDVRHAIDAGEPVPHRLSVGARLIDGQLLYRLDEGQQGQLPGL